MAANPDGPRHNDVRKAEAIRLKIRRAHAWRVQVHAQSERRIRSYQNELKVLGFEPEDLFEPEYDDDEMLNHYAEMPLPS